MTTTLGRPDCSITTTAAGDDDVLTPEALEFVAELCRRFGAARADLLAVRSIRSAQAADGQDPCFRADTVGIRHDPSWGVAEPPDVLADARVALVAPPTAAGLAEVRRSRPDLWIADFGDALAPTWRAVLQGHRAVIDAVCDATTIPVVVRPRGWHFCELHLRLGTGAIPASFVDAGLYLWHVAGRLAGQGTGPLFELAGLHSAAEAALWHDVFRFAEDRLGLPRGTIRASASIDTVWAAFEMNEILHALGPYAVGLCSTMTPYVHSAVRTFGGRGVRYLAPDRADIPSAAPFLRAQRRLLVETCHRRGALALAPTISVVPDQSDSAAAAQTLQDVRAEIIAQAVEGFDRARVAVTDLIPVARDVLSDALGDRRDQRSVLPAGPRPAAAQLLDIVSAPNRITAAAVRGNVATALRQLDAWLQGHGTVVLDGAVADAATGELARAQLWHWRDAGATLADGRVVTGALLAAEIDQAQHQLAEEAAASGRAGRMDDAAALLREAVLGDNPNCITVHAYARYLVDSRLT